MANVYYRTTDQVERVDNVFFLQLQKALCSQVLFLLGDFNHCDICWKSSTMSCKQSRRLLESTDDNFLIPLIEGLTSREALLDLLLTNSELIREVKIAGSLVCSEHTLAMKMVRGLEHPSLL